MKHYGLYIDGKWGSPKDNQTFESRNPATGGLLGTFTAGTADDVEAAVAAAKKAFVHWKRIPAPRRGEILLAAASILQQRKEELGRLVTLEMGKVLAEGKGDVQEAIDFLQYISGEGRRLYGQTTPSELADKLCMTLHEPAGVVGCITPWNFPFAVPSWKLGAALIAGNCVVFKPASLTPLCAVRLVEIFEEAGLPPGVLNLLTGLPERVGPGLIQHPDIRVLSFTGSLEAGRKIYAAASQTMKRVTLELGGKNPMIVLDDADLALALEGVLFGAFGTAGQRCTATSRLILQEGVYERFLEALLGKVKGLRIGDPQDSTVDMGPVCGREQESKICHYIEWGQQEGARLLCGGHKLTGTPYEQGFFIAPTIFAATPEMRIAREEIFGPVLSVLRAKDYGAAIAVANDVPYGLSAAVYTQDINTAFRAVGDLETGIVYINAPTIGAEVHLPFGGVKNTGIGTREAGPTAIEEFTETKTVFIDHSGRLQKAQIRD